VGFDSRMNPGANPANIDCPIPRFIEVPEPSVRNALFAESRPGHKDRVAVPARRMEWDRNDQVNTFSGMTASPDMV